MVVTVEPGIYIPEGSDCHQKYWSIGIRIEDDVVVTEEGRSVLSAFAPQSPADIEMLMKKKGIGNQEVGKE
jgi:Xaa-Pro aminopeptidase